MEIKNKIIIGTVIVTLAVGGYFAGEALSKNSKAKNKFSGDFNFQRDSDFPRPERNPEIMGRIQAVNENKITIGKFKTPSRENVSQEGIAQIFSPGGSERGEAEEKIRERQKTTAREIIGEEILAVKAETKILKRSGIQRAPAGDKNNAEEISLSDIKEGDNAMVWLKQDKVDEKTAELIIITNFKE